MITKLFFSTDVYAMRTYHIGVEGIKGVSASDDVYGCGTNQAEN